MTPETIAHTLRNLARSCTPFNARACREAAQLLDPQPVKKPAEEQRKERKNAKRAQRWDDLPFTDEAPDGDGG